MGRIDEAVRRSTGGWAMATLDSVDQRQFRSAWTDGEPRAAASSPTPSAAVLDGEDSILVAEPGARLPRINPAWRERLASDPECRPELLTQFNRLAATLLKCRLQAACAS